MKKYILALVLMVILLGSARALAASTAANPGILPDSKWYFLDKMGEWFDQFFTFGAKNKAELAVSLAQERSAEIQALLQKDGPNASGLNEALSGLAKSKDDAKNAVAKISDMNEKADVAKQTSDDFDELEQAVQNNLGQQIQALIENFKSVKEDLQAQIKAAQKSGDTKAAADLRDQLVTKEADLRDQIHALQQKLGETQQQMNEDQKVLDDSLDQKDQSEAAKQTQEAIREQAKQAAEVVKQELELVNEHAKDVQEQKQDLEKELNN